MGRRRHTPEQIITALREAEVGLANGRSEGPKTSKLHRNQGKNPGGTRNLHTAVAAS